MLSVSSKVWVATLISGVFFMSLISCQKKEKTQSMEIVEETKGEEVKEKEQPMIVSEAEQNIPSSKIQKGIFFSIRAKTSLSLSKEPRLGETIDLTLTVTPPKDAPILTVAFKARSGVVLIEPQKAVESNAKKDETKKFAAKIKITSSPVHFIASVNGVAVLDNGKRVPLEGGSVLRLVIIDEETKQFGTPGQKLAMGPEYRYDMASGEIFPPGEFSGSGIYAREMIERLKKVEPKLTDWQAIYLHRDALRALWKGIGGSEDERIKWLLKEGWFNKHKDVETEKDMWLDELIQQKLIEHKKSKN
jgi:hypothetical protein